MTQPPVTVPHVRSTVFPGGSPLAAAWAVAPTVAGLSYVRSRVATPWLDAGAAAGDVVDGEREHAVNAAANAAAVHGRPRNSSLIPLIRSAWLRNDGDLRGLDLEGLELAGAPLRIFCRDRIPHDSHR